MPQQYTVVYSHPRGGTATFIYQGGELSALAKGLDPEQFWVFKQVKALLLRNDEGDLELATRMMAQHGFQAQVMRAPLPDLLASVQPTAPRKPAAAAPPAVRFRARFAPAYDYPVYKRAQQISEMHWREGGYVPVPPPHRAPSLPIPPAAPNYTGGVNPWHATQTPQISEMHWRAPEDSHA